MDQFIFDCDIRQGHHIRRLLTYLLFFLFFGFAKMSCGSKNNVNATRSIFTRKRIHRVVDDCMILQLGQTSFAIFEYHNFIFFNNIMLWYYYTTTT